MDVIGFTIFPRWSLFFVVLVGDIKEEEDDDEWLGLLMEA